MSDRTIHAVLKDGTEIVRYRRAGKWYAESPECRVAMTVRSAALLATRPDADVRLGLSGGAAFDRAYRRCRPHQDLRPEGDA